MSFISIHVCALQTLHKTGWMQIRSYGEENFPVFNQVPKKRTGVERDYEVKPLDPQLQPWLASSMTGLQGGVRNANSEMVVYVANLVTQGVVSAPKVSFLVQSLQSGAANAPNSFVAVVFMPNRACDGRVKTCLDSLAWLSNFNNIIRSCATRPLLFLSLRKGNGNKHGPRFRMTGEGGCIIPLQFPYSLPLISLPVSLISSPILSCIGSFYDFSFKCSVPYNFPYDVSYA